MILCFYPFSFVSMSFLITLLFCQFGLGKVCIHPPYMLLSHAKLDYSSYGFCFLIILSIVLQDYGEDTEGLHVVQEYVKSH